MFTDNEMQELWQNRKGGARDNFIFHDLKCAHEAGHSTISNLLQPTIRTEFAFNEYGEPCVKTFGEIDFGDSTEVKNCAMICMAGYVAECLDFFGYSDTKTIRLVSVAIDNSENKTSDVEKARFFIRGLREVFNQKVTAKKIATETVALLKAHWKEFKKETAKSKAFFGQIKGV